MWMWSILPLTTIHLVLKLSLLFNVLGRIAFPLFALFLVEGFFIEDRKSVV